MHASLGICNLCGKDFRDAEGTESLALHIGLGHNQV